jgi:hypothetical protein
VNVFVTTHHNHSATHKLYSCENLEPTDITV